MYLLTACTTNRKAEVATPDVATPATDVRTKTEEKPVKALPHVYIYKTKADYSNLVPVTMNPERTRIISYPATSDIRPSAQPIPLIDGWYLDRRGIGPNTVFTDYTYEEYSRLDHTPPPPS